MCSQFPQLFFFLGDVVIRSITNERQVNKTAKEALVFTQQRRVKPAYAGFLLWFTATQSKRE